MQLREALLTPRHEPVVRPRTDGLWEVICPACRLDVDSETPIGIEMPLKSRSTAERIVQNHAYDTIERG
jgi:hypothetical protein